MIKKKKDMRKFSDKIYPEPNTGCWLWSGSYNPSGHGKIKPSSHNGFGYAHRYSFFIHNGEFDRSMQVLHHCDNPHCVNPDHLYLGDQKQNMRDASNRKRFINRRGSKASRSILTEDQVLEIRRTFKTRSKEFGSDALAKKYGVGVSNIQNILCRLSWKHI